MSDYIQKVTKFHKLFKLPILDTPCIPKKERTELRISLIQEELEELKEAIANNDITEVCDAFADLQYVLSGAILEFGLGDKFNDLFNEVQRSNMSKACSSVEEAEETIKHYNQKDGTEAYYMKEGGDYIVYRKSDNKVLKSIKYSAVNFEKILNN